MQTYRELEGASVSEFESPPIHSKRFPQRALILRIAALALLFIAELLIITTLIDGAALAGATGLAGVIRESGAWILRVVVGVSAIFVTFVWLKSRPALEQISLEIEKVPVGWALLAFHFAAMACFGALSSSLYAGGVSSTVLAGAWLAAGAGGIILASLAFLPYTHWLRLIASGGKLWIYALVSILAACIAGNYSRGLWQPATRLTFKLVKFLLQPFVAGLVTNADLRQIGTRNFRVIVSPECSGLEGAGLILAFGITWILLFRRECRFPQSLLLIPAGVLVLFFLNAVRIAALLLIGDAGAKTIALGGFHSQAGWILFNGVAAGFCVTIRNVPWFTTSVRVPEERAETDNPTAAYLAPFLAILAAGIIAAAASGGFEWLYSLRLLAASAALWIFRKQYAGVDWRASWLPAAAGALVSAVWMVLDRFAGSEEHGMPAALLTVSPLVRYSWIALRAITAIAIVPVAEELAFRGFLMRRFISADFETVDPRRLTWFALIASSVVFGVLHGGHWMAGVFAGIVFGLLWKRRGRLGDAVAAHAAANGLLAAYVLIYGQWHLW